MHGKILIVLLLSSCVSTLPDESEVTSHPIANTIQSVQETPNPLAPHHSTIKDIEVISEGTRRVTLAGEKETEGILYKPEHTSTMVHDFSMPVITIIIFAVMAAIIGVILGISFAVGHLTKKPSTTGNNEGAV